MKTEKSKKKKREGNGIGPKQPVWPSTASNPMAQQTFPKPFSLSL
jgi:hypothetical protein